jgi:hypothetical protein
VLIDGVWRATRCLWLAFAAERHEDTTVERLLKLPRSRGALVSSRAQIRAALAPFSGNLTPADALRHQGDGTQDLDSAAIDQDAARDGFLAGLGSRIVRVAASDVIGRPDCIRRLVARLR